MNWDCFCKFGHWPHVLFYLGDGSFAGRFPVGCIFAIKIAIGT